jgi:hypothetical protein
VQKIVDRYGVDLAKVQGTGKGGRLTPDDVLNACAAGRQKQQASARPVAPQVAAPQAGPRPPAGADPKLYARNPLVDEASALPGGRRLVTNAAKNDPSVPTLFASGDLPVFTASGVDPSALLSVPWYARHAVAAAPSRAEAFGLIEAYSGPDGDIAAKLEGTADHPGNLDYQGRVTEWLMRGETAAQVQNRDREWSAAMEARRRETPAGQMSDAEVYDQAFGPIDRQRAERDRVKGLRLR